MNNDEEIKEVLKQMATENEKNTNTNNKEEYLGIRLIVSLILIAIMIWLVSSIIGSFNNKSTENSNKGEPDNIELMSYAQTVLKDNLNNPKFSSNKDEYTFIKTNLRYKIEGYVTTYGKKEKFYMIIQFVDDNYKEYDLISLQVGNNNIY